MSLSVIPLTILGQITGVTGSGETALYQVSFKSIDGTPLYGVTAVWTDEQAEIEALAAQKPYGVWINPIDGTLTVKFAGYTYVGSADLTDSDVLAGITPIEFANQNGGGGLPAVTDADNGKMLQVEDGGWKAKQYPVETVDNVYYDDTVTLTSGSIAPLILEGDYNLDNFAVYTVEVDGEPATYITSPQAGFVYPANSMTPIAIGVNDGAVFATTYGYGSGEEHTIKISYPQESVDANFKKGVQMALGAEVIFEGDLENEVPVSFDNYESNSALMYDIYINDKLCKRLSYSVLSGAPAYSTYDTTGELYVEISPSAQKITLYANEGDTCHVKIVKKSRPESIMVFATKSGDVILVDAAFGDILTAAKKGYTFGLAIDGQISGATRYSEIGTLQASIDTSTHVATFASTVTWQGQSITWTVNMTDMSISGTVGGINA